VPLTPLITVKIAKANYGVKHLFLASPTAHVPSGAWRGAALAQTKHIMNLLEKLNNHIMIMAPHQRDREQGKLIIEARDRIKELEAANNELFKIKQKTVVENLRLKREITTYRSFAESQKGEKT
jgi:hypothetical protein